MTKEKRGNARKDLRFKVTIAMKHKGPHEVKGLSVDGLFIRTPNPSMFGRGDEVELVMQLPAEDSPVRLNARIAHVAEDGIGLEFLNVTNDDQEALEHCLSLAFLASPFPSLVEGMQETGMGFEKRRNRRVDIHFPVKKMGTKHERTDTVKNLSVGGLFIETASPSEFQEEDEIELVLEDPAGDNFMRFDARVAHVGKKGIGVAFLNVTVEDQEALNTWFDAVRHTLPKIDG